MTSLDALELTVIPKKGMKRYFVWLIKLNALIEPRCRLSDKELIKLSKILNKKIS